METIDASAVEGQVVDLLAERVASGNKIIVFGCGGQAANAMHLEAELAGKFEEFESCLPCICLGLNPCYVTAVTNDFGWDQVFARQIRSLAKSGDVLVGLTVSGKGDYYQKAISEAQLQGCFIVQIAGPDCWRPVGRALVIQLGKDTPSLQEEQLQCIHRLCRRIKLRFNGRSLQTGGIYHDNAKDHAAR